MLIYLAHYYKKRIFVDVNRNVMKYVKNIYLIIILSFLPIINISGETLTAKQIARQGADFYYAERYPQALRRFIKGVEVAEIEGDNYYYMVCTGFIGNIYNSYGDFGGCLYYTRKGYDMAAKMKDEKMQIMFLQNLVFFNCCTGDLTEARKCYILLNKIPFSGEINQIYFNLYSKARLSRYGGKLAQGIKEHEATLRFAQTHNMKPIFVLYQMSEIGNIYVEMHEYAKAVEMGNKCLEMAKQIKSNNLQINAYKMLADAYDGMGQREKADNYRKQYFALNEKVYNLKEYFSIRNSLTQYEDMLTDRHISSLKNIILWVSLAVIILVIFIIIIVKKNKSLRDAQRLLIQKNNELQQSEIKSNQLMKKYLGSEETKSDANSDEDTDSNASSLGREQSDQLLKHIIAAMEDNEAVFNPDFSLTTLATMVNSNTKYVSMVINDTYQKNFKTLVNERRVHEACKRLVDNEHYGNMTIQAIYEEVGYRNAVSFIRVFKKVMGMTPSVYQKLSKD